MIIHKIKQMWLIDIDGPHLALVGPKATPGKTGGCLWSYKREAPGTSPGASNFHKPIEQPIEVF